MAQTSQSSGLLTAEQQQVPAAGGLLSPRLWGRAAVIVKANRQKNDTKSSRFVSDFDRWASPENDLPDEVLWQYSDLDSVSRNFLKHGARSAAEKLAYAQQVNPLAHLDAELASQDVQHEFQQSGNLDQSQYFVGPDGRAYLRNEDSEEQPGAKIRRGYENAIGGFPTYDINESLRQISEATRSKRADVELYNPPTLPEQEERERFLAPFAVNPAAWQSGDRAPEDMQKIFRDAPNLWHPYPNSYLGPDGVVYEMNELTAPEPFGQFHKAREEWERQQFLRTLPPPSDEELYWRAVESSPVLLRGRFRTARGPQGRFIPPGGEEARAQIRARLDEIPRLAALYGLKQAPQPGATGKSVRSAGSSAGGRTATQSAASAASAYSLPARSFTRNPMSAEEFAALSQYGKVDPYTIRTIQNTASTLFRSEGKLAERRHLVDTIRALQKNPDALANKSIRIFARDGKVWTLDHRRLIAAREAGVEVYFRKATAKEVAKEIGRKWSTTDDGMSIIIGSSSSK